MTCTDWFEVVSAAADDQLAPDERARLDAHLATCPSCQALLGTFERERRRRRMAPPTDHGALMGEVLARRALEPAPARVGRELARRGVAAAAAVVVAIALLAAAPTVTARSQPAPVLADGEVRIDAGIERFDDATVEVPAGTTVEWRNAGSETHHLVRKLGGVVVSEDLAPGRSEVATFAEPGTYEFWCTVHDGMTGTVTVDA